MNKQRCRFVVGDRVVASAAWEPNDFDGWGRGVGVGEVVETCREAGDVVPSDRVDVRWPAGRCYEDVSQLELAGASCEQ